MPRSPMVEVGGQVMPKTEFVLKYMRNNLRKLKGKTQREMSEIITEETGTPVDFRTVSFLIRKSNDLQALRLDENFKTSVANAPQERKLNIFQRLEIAEATNNKLTDDLSNAVNRILALEELLGVSQ